MSSLWVLVIGTCVGCYALKLAGYLVPARLLGQPRIRRLVEMLPVALLAGLVMVELLAQGEHWQFDGARIAGFGVGAIAVWRRAPFIVVVLVSATTAALLRLL